MYKLRKEKYKIIKSAEFKSIGLFFAVFSFCWFWALRHGDVTGDITVTKSDAGEEEYEYEYENEYVDEDNKD